MRIRATSTYHIFKQCASGIAGLLLFLVTGTGVLAQTVVNETTDVRGSYTVSSSGTVTITITGADGGNGTSTSGGEGATATATFAVTPGDVIRYVVGERGTPSTSGSSAGGGGSTGVLINSTIVMVAGGGGGGDNSNGAVGLGGNSGINGDAGTGSNAGAAGTNGNGGGASNNAGGGGGVFSDGGSASADGGARADNTLSDVNQLVSFASGGDGSGSGTDGGRGFTGGGGAAKNYGGGGGGYSGGGGGGNGSGSNGRAGGGGSYVHSSAISQNITAGGNGDGTQKDGSIQIIFTLDNTSPDAPANVSASALEGGDIQISFDDVDESGTGVVSYSVKRSTTPGSGYTEITTIADNESSTYTFTDNTALDGITYYYVVTALDMVSNESANSTEVSATPDATEPMLEAITANGLSVELDYNELLNLASVPETGAFTVLVNTVQRTVTNVSVSSDKVTLTLSSEIVSSDVPTIGYTPGANPIEDQVGNDALAFSNQNVDNQTITSIPAPPIEVEVQAIENGEISITFEDVDSPNAITGYIIKRAVNAGGPYTSIGTVTDNESSTYTFVDNTANHGTQYYYVITSVDQNMQESLASEAVSAISDANAPSYQLISVAGQYVTIDYDEPLDAASVPSLLDFSVLVNGASRTIENIYVVGPRVILDIYPEVQSGDNVQLSYIPGVNVVQDVAGNDAVGYTGESVLNNTYSSQSYGPNPCPISNNHDAAWACFSGANNGTSMIANVGGLTIATVDAAGGSATTFAPNALQEWASGAFSGDEFNGPQVNPSGTSGDATSLDINIPANIPSDALILSLNRLRPNGGATSYTLEAFDEFNNKLDISGWTYGLGTDGGICTNSVSIGYSGGNTTLEFQPVVSGNPSCSNSSVPVWFRISQSNVRRIELRKTTSGSDNIHLGLAIVADFGDAPATYGTLYSGTGTPPAFHLLNNGSPNTVYFGSAVDADGNGAPSSTANGDDSESTGLGSGDDEDAISTLPSIFSSQNSVEITLSCTGGGYVGAWIDFDNSGTFDVDEFTSGECSANSVTLNWTGLSGLVEGNTMARFRIASSQQQVSQPTGAAMDGEVEDFSIEILPPSLVDLYISKQVDRSNPVEGDTVVYTLSLTNPSEYDATGIWVTDLLPSDVTYISSTPSQGTYNFSTGIWNVGNIPSGDSTTVTLQVAAQVNSGTLGKTINNTASITALNETDPELSNNSAIAGITVVPEQADIDISIGVSNATPIEGEFIDYTITVSNNGPKTATDLTILAQLPSGLTFIDSTLNVGSYNVATGIWDIGILAPGSSVDLEINARVKSGTEGTTIIYSTAVDDMLQEDVVEENNTASVSIAVAIPTTSLSCGDAYPKFDNATLISGSNLQVGAVYRFDSILPGVYAEVEILTINNVTLLQLDAPGTQSGVGSDDEFAPYINNHNEGSGYVDFNIAFFDSATGLEKYLTFSATAADVDGTGDLRDYIGYQNLNSFVVENSTSLLPGTESVYTTFISSNYSNVVPGDANFTNYKVYATYTNETEFLIRMGIDANNTEGSRIMSLNFNPCEYNTFTNPVTNPVVDIAVIKSVNDNSVNVGQQITYTVTAENKKAAAAGGIEITDELPSGLTFVSANPSQGTYNSGTGIWNVGSLAGLEQATLEIVASVNSGTQGNTIKNTATLTDVSGNDGLGTNNQSSVDIIVFDPNSGLSCNEPPLFSFLNYNLVQGVQNQVNSVYRYSNVAPGIDAIVTVLDIHNATINYLDDDGTNTGGQATASNFSPVFTTNNGTSDGYIDWEIKFVQANTNIPVKNDFSVTATDIDGTNSGGGTTIRDFYGFAQNYSNTVQSGNNLDPIYIQDNFEIFRSAVTTDANGTFDIDHMAYITYKYTSEFKVRTGSTPTGGYPNERLVEFNFTPCLNQEFTNPIVSTRDADLAITKTVDEANPLENETINFTITVTNHGSENATEIDVDETIPSGLTLVQSTPSQGTYNELTNIWTLGSLLTGEQATLELETTVNSGITADSLINKTYIFGFNQNDPNVGNDSALVVIKVGTELKGVVFQDITGDGVSEDMTFNDATGDQQALENVEVHLFMDGGDGLANGADDVFLQTKLTNNLGEYTFKIGDQATYWIVVDSKTGELTNGSFWAEQTYAPAGGLCEDGSGNTQVLVSAGHCFGGRRGDESDMISATPVAADLANAEHIAKVVSTGTGIDEINFGFSFNVVTHTNDDDNDPVANRSSQGSLRQFITNANEISGANTMRFVPTVPTNASGNGGNWWSVTVGSELPVFTDGLTTIDGTAYQNSNPKSVRDDNAGTVGVGGSVGMDNLAGATIPRAELEINLNDIGANALVVNASGPYTVRNVALYNNSTGIRVVGGSSGLFEKNLIGSRADGSAPAPANRLETGVLFDGTSSVTPILQQNYLAYLNGSGIHSTNQSSNITVHNNEIYQTALGISSADGIEGIGTWSITQNRIHEVGNGSSAAANGGSGIELGAVSGSSSANTVRNNTIYDNAVAGISTTNRVENSLVEKNIIYQNGTNYSSSSTKYGAGIKLATPSAASQFGIRITRNSFYNNYGVAIDLVTGSGAQADGVSPNDGALVSETSTPNGGLDYPVFTLATLENGVLHVEGYVGTSTTNIEQAFTIEVYKANDDGDSDAPIEVGGSLIRAHGEGQYLIGVITTTANGTFSEDIPVPGGVSLAYNDRITATAISSVSNTSEFSANHRVVPTGVSISGYVYHDTNHNEIKDAVETGLENVTIVLYNTQENNCKSVLTNSNGYYEFTNVLNGTYNLIESYGQSVPTPDICTPTEVDPDDFISTTPNLRTVIVNNLPASQNFGDYEGSKVSGTVINDNGISGGTANDGNQNGGEQGIPTQVIKAVTGSEVLIEQTTSAADGSFSLYIPKSMVPNGGTVKISETNGASYISTGGSAGTTGGTYTIATDGIQFTNMVGTIYTDVLFADVQTTRFLTNGTKTVQPGAVSIFTHIFEPNTAGEVIFSTSSVNNPNITWPVVVNHDLDCNGTIDSGEPILSNTSGINVEADEDICLVVRVTAPSGVNDGASSATTITATFEFANSPSNIQQVLQRSDIVTVSTQYGGLVIIKAVDKAQALPGDTLTYTINYENLGDEPISQIEVTDEVPVYTTYSSGNCGVLPPGVTNCSITAPSIGSRGTVRWTLTGILQPGESGTVSYKVLIDN